MACPGQPEHRQFLMWILDEDGDPVTTTSTMEYMQFESDYPRKCLRRTEIDEDTFVSTIFYGSVFGDYNVKWETMIMGGPHNHYQRRCGDKETAIEQHERAVRIAKGEEVEEQEDTCN